MRLITKQEMLSLYELNVLFEVINVGDRIIGKSVKGQADNPKVKEVVYCLV